MKEYTCRFCKNIFKFNIQQHFAQHCASCKDNPNIINNTRSIKLTKQARLKNPITKYKFNCKKCNKEYELDLKLSDYNKNNYRVHCSRKCANGKIWTDADKLKKSIAAKNSDKVKKANLLLRKRVGRRPIIIKTDCLFCGHPIYHHPNKIRKYHRDCWYKCCGGLQEGSSRGKSGYYKGYKCDSSYELAWIIYNIDHNIKFKRNVEGFEYIFENKKHKYYPDFILEDNSYVEIKNYNSLQLEAKIKYFPHKITILYGNDLADIFQYVIENYGKDYIKLYEQK